MSRFCKSAYLLLIACIALAQVSCAQKKQKRQLIFYNVENLFDTIPNNTGTDDEYTPTGSKKWDTERYNEKLNHLSRVIASASRKNLPDIIALCEVENRSVLKDLVATDQLKSANYGIVHYDSPDFRGIDNALLYHPSHFDVISSEAIRVQLPDTSRTTRDILFVKGVWLEADTFLIFVNHFPSRRGGREQSEPNRLAVSKILQSSIAEHAENSPEAHVIVVGDFNDTPSDKSLLKLLSSKSGQSKLGLHNISASFPDTVGTYYYRGKWQMLDQCLVSSNLVTAGSTSFWQRLSGSYQAHLDEFNVVKHPFMLYYNKRDNVHVPSRSFGGPNYYGGYSDHLPISLSLVISK